MKYFSHKDFNLDFLVKEKKTRGMSIGIGLPVRNESATLGPILEVLKGCMVSGLIDDLIVLDSGSTDSSREIAATAGVRTILDSDTAAKYGVPLARGKGWNLWTSVLELKTDYVFWVDSDIQNFDKRFVLGLVGPVLCNSDIAFVKGFYDRPEGARVTELVVRPFINLLYPESSEFIQPLSGEFGGKRDTGIIAWHP